MINLQNASEQELRDYAQDELGIDFPKNMKPATMIKRIQEQEGVESEGVVDSQEDAKPSRPKFVSISIPKTEGDTGSKDVFVAVNGRTYLIKRGETVRVPYGVYSALKDAVERKYETIHDPKTNTRELVSREVQAYPVQVTL
jgi:hypothetical protein